MRLWGLMAGPDIVTPCGLAVWDQLDAEWKPTDDELKAVVARVLAPVANQQTQTGIYTLLKEFRDDRERMQKYVTRPLHEIRDRMDYEENQKRADRDSGRPSKE
jgi:hypothetical protein